MKFFVFLIPYIILFALSFFPVWFLFFHPNLLRVLIGIFLCIHFVVEFFLKLEFIKLKKTSILVFGALSSLFIILFPIRDLRLGDGLLLLENMSLETAIYGYQLITDEILEGLIHSLTHNVIKEDPRISFQIWSSLAGFILIFGLGKYFWNKKNGAFSFFIFLASNGFLLFYGYAENYSLTTAYLIAIILFLAHNVESNRFISPYLLGVLAGFGALLHLVFVYTIFSFAYLTWLFSKNKKEFMLNSFKSSVIGLLLLFFVFDYFFFFSDLRIDLGMSHVTTHKFYPIKRWFSIQHFKEIFYCIFFTTLPSIFLFLYSWVFDKQNLKAYLSTSLGKYLLIVLLGFFLHAFWHNPQLGFPADWDLMSFYWSIITILSIKFLERTNLNLNHIFLSSLFCFVFLQMNAFFLSQENLEIKQSVEQVIETISQFKKIYSKNPEGVSPKDRKFHLHTSYFFFRTISYLEKHGAPIELIQTGKNLKYEFEAQKGSYSKKWKKDFLIRSTKFHERYLNFKK